MILVVKRRKRALHKLLDMHGALKRKVRETRKSPPQPTTRTNLHDGFGR
jgi:hypothetical protein